MTRWPAAKQSKYKAKQTVIDGIKFPSMAEARYYCQLKLLQQAGEIAGFCRQPRFVLSAGIEYVADFMVDYWQHTEVVEIKGMETDSWKLKKRLFEDKYPGMQFKIIKAGDVR
jgi:hypothetical protein